MQGQDPIDTIDSHLKEQGIPFGKYSLVAKLAIGGMAELFVAKQKGMGGFRKTVAVKCILPYFARDKEFIEMFLDEARLAAHLNHPNVVHINDIGDVDGVYYMAMEYISGQNLKAFAKRLYTQEGYRRQPPFELIASIFVQALQGLEHVHNAADDNQVHLQLVHRDISPNNLMLSYDGNVKIVDFGVAKAKTQERETQVGVLKGRLSYMSPEHLSGLPLDGRSDIFAIGVVLYELSTNRRLFKRKSEAETMQALMTSPIPAPSKFYASYPRGLEEIVMKALERDPNNRYQSAVEMQEALEDWLATCENPILGNRHIISLMEELFAEEKELDRKGEYPKPVTQDDLMNLARGSYRVMQDGSIQSYFAPPSSIPPVDVAPNSLRSPAQRRSTPTSSYNEYQSGSHEQAWAGGSGSGERAGWSGDVHLAEQPAAYHASQPAMTLPSQEAVPGMSAVQMSSPYMQTSSMMPPDIQEVRLDEEDGDGLVTEIHIGEEPDDVLAPPTAVQAVPPGEEEEPTDSAHILDAPKPLPAPTSLNKPKPPMAAASEVSHRSSKSHMPLIIGGLVLLLFGGGAGAWWFLSRPAAIDGSQSAGATDQTKANDAPQSPPERPAPRPAVADAGAPPAVDDAGPQGAGVGARTPPRVVIKIPASDTPPKVRPRRVVRRIRRRPVRPRKRRFVRRRRRRSGPLRAKRPFSSIKLARKVRLPVYTYIGGRRTYTRAHPQLCRKIEREVGKLFGNDRAVRGITKPWQRYVKKRFRRSRGRKYVFYPRAAAYVIFRDLSRGKGWGYAAKNLVKYQKYYRFSKYRNK